ncbi:TetR/AcrR family transcriptional regulator [Nocardia sp. NPDC049149]|uniref:TetR/AcrR family transcriptional regulator n=1 Tax=Nocardia sp. NPDC049149 TaxID=3364315 RepID=UPI00371B94A4
MVTRPGLYRILGETLNEVTTDGRRSKGERRRRALIEATLRVIERDGASGVTHRAVAREAGLPTTAATYYFDGVDGLLTAALTTCMDDDAEKMRQLTVAADDSDSLHALARLMAEIVATPGRLLAEFELCLLASRRPDLRGPTDRWKGALADFARRYTADPVRIQLFTNAYDGLLLHALLADQPPTVDEFEAMLRELLPDAR